MNYTCIKFQNDNREPTAKNAIQKVLLAMFEFILPRANPDFDRKFHLVDKWLVEFSNETNEPIREIGIDDHGEVIMIMPWQDNHGFWTDLEIKIDEFQKFNFKIITQTEFEDHWRKFRPTEIH